MILKRKFCIYCNQEMESKTTKKRFCSDKCRVYWNRENPNGVIISPIELNNRLKSKENVSKTEDKPKIEEIPVQNEKTPPNGLKGIDLAIWKSENWK